MPIYISPLQEIASDLIVYGMNPPLGYTCLGKVLVVLDAPQPNNKAYRYY